MKKGSKKVIKSYYLAKILFKMRIPSFNHCDIDSTAKVSAGSVFSNVKMGRYSYVGAATYATDVRIGAFCSIGGDVHIGGGVHPMGTVSTSPVFLKGSNFLHKHYASIPYKPSETVYIGNDVWIGDGAYIKAGVTIGTGAVIGAHAVVTHDVMPYAIVVGVPGRMIRKRFDEDTIMKLLKLKWWEWPDQELEKYGEYFSSPEKLIEMIEKE